MKKIKFDIRKPKAFKIKKTTSLKEIHEMQRELKETINKLQMLYNEIDRLRKEKAFNEEFNK